MYLFTLENERFLVAVGRRGVGLRAHEEEGAEAQCGILQRRHRYLRERERGRTLGFFREMVEGKVRPDSKTFNSLLAGCSRAGEVDYARVLFEEMMRLGIGRDIYTYNTFIDAVSKCRNMELAVKIMTEMPANDLRPNVVTFSTPCKVCARSFYFKPSQDHLQIKPLRQQNSVNPQRLQFPPPTTLPAKFPTFHPINPPPSSYLPLSQTSPIMAPNSSFLLLLLLSLSSSSLLPAAAECAPRSPHPYTALLRDYLPPPTVKSDDGRAASPGSAPKVSPATARSPLSSPTHSPMSSLSPKSAPSTARSPLSSPSSKSSPAQPTAIAPSPLDSVKSAAAKAAGSVANAAGSAAQSASAAAPKSVDAVKSAAATVTAAAPKSADAVKSAAATVTAAAPKSADAVKSAAGSVAETVAAATPKASSPVDTAKAATAAVSDAASSVAQTVTDAIKSVTVLDGSLKEICDKLPVPATCMSVLPTAAKKDISKLDLKAALELNIEAMIDGARSARDKARGMAVNDEHYDPINMCNRTMGSAMGDVKDALTGMAEEDYGTVNTMLDSYVHSIGVCLEGGPSRKPPQALVGDMQKLHDLYENGKKLSALVSPKSVVVLPEY